MGDGATKNRRNKNRNSLGIRFEGRTLKYERKVRNENKTLVTTVLKEKERECYTRESKNEREQYLKRVGLSYELVIGLQGLLSIDQT